MRDVCCTGMASGDHTAFVRITNEEIDRREVEDACIVDGLMPL
jgi:hypothetical protein